MLSATRTWLLSHVATQVDAYEDLLAVKRKRAQAVLGAASALGPPGSVAPPELVMHRSAASHYRQRLDLWVRSQARQALCQAACKVDPT